MIKKPERLIESMIAYALPVIKEAEKIPSMYHEAVASSDREKLMTTMKDEMHSFYKNATWKLTKLPKGM